MRITTLASGSQGNAVLLESRRLRLLIDVGLERKELEDRLQSIDVPPRTIDAALLTHRHADHMRGATEFCSRHKVRVYAPRATARRLGTECGKRIQRIVPLEWFGVGHLRVMPVPVEHDAPNTVAYLVEDGPIRYGHVTDLGSTHGHVRQLLTHCTGLYLEFNHDPELLQNGEYPPNLKKRIAGPRGHLSNAQAADLLAALAHPRLQHVWLAHLSRRNNRPELAVAAARDALSGSRVEFVVAMQDEVGAPVELLERGSDDIDVAVLSMSTGAPSRDSRRFSSAAEALDRSGDVRIHRHR